MLVQRGETSLTGTTKTATITLDTPVPVGKSFPLISRRANTHFRMDSEVTAELTAEADGHYTAIKLTRARADYDVTVIYQVISGDEFTVQSGVKFFSTADLTVSIPVSQVDLPQTFVVTTTRQASSDTTAADAKFRVRASLAETALTLSRNAGDHGLNVVWHVVTMDGATVQQLTTETTELSVDITASSVNLEKTFLLHSWQSNLNGFFPANSWAAHLVDSTTVRLRRNYSSTSKATCFVVSHPKLKVVSGLTAMDAGVSAAQEYASADPSLTFTLTNTATSTSTNGSYLHGILCTHKVENNNIHFQRNSATIDCELAWFVVEWKPVVAPSALKPNNVALMPAEPTTFSWKKETDMTATAYEISWRESEGEWQDSGKIASDKQYHAFDADTFQIGKDYEWRVRHWDNEQEDPSDWTSATFNTADPVIQSPTPWPDSSVRVDILQFGGRVKSPYGRAVQLTIEIAGDADFTSPTTYALPAVESGEVAIVDHAVTEGGTWYIRMTATDTESLQTVLVYSFFAGQFLLFVEAPRVETQGPSATHVTVRVKGTTTEYTAVANPAPPPEKITERLIEIESGTVAQCQEVAERLLERWGREQRSVSGTVDLIVTLKYQQKVRVKHPPAGIDEEMILQKKEHDVLGSQTTHVTLGDIILSDDELLARVLDELVG